LLKATAELGRLQQRLLRRLTYAGLVLFALGVAWWLLAGFVDLVVVFDALGRGAVGAAGVAGGIVLLPLTYAVAPLYAALTWGDWMPLLFSAAGSSILALIGGFMQRGMRPRSR
jgi:hypothetical protein